MAKVDDLSQYELPKLHSAVSAGEPLNREVIDTFKNISISKCEMVTGKQKARC